MNDNNEDNMNSNANANDGGRMQDDADATAVSAAAAAAAAVDSSSIDLEQMLHHIALEDDREDFQLMYRRRIHQTKQLIEQTNRISCYIGENSSQPAPVPALQRSERILQQVANRIGVFYDRYQAFNIVAVSQEESRHRNPFTTYLAQCRHRLAQVSLLLGKLDVACTLFLHVIFNDPTVLSRTALAMTWYDIALVYLYNQQYVQSQVALNQAVIAILQNGRRSECDGPGGPHEAMLFFIHQVWLRIPTSMRTTELTATMSGRRNGINNDSNQATTATASTQQHQQQQQQQQRPTRLPWSMQFTIVSYNFDEDDDDDDSNREGAITDDTTSSSSDNGDNTSEEDDGLDSSNIEVPHV